MKKEKVLDSLFLCSYTDKELRSLASQGRIDENQANLAIVFRDMRLQDAVKVINNHSNMTGSRNDLVAFFENSTVSEATRVAATVFLCNK